MEFRACSENVMGTVGLTVTLVDLTVTLCSMNDNVPEFVLSTRFCRLMLPSIRVGIQTVIAELNRTDPQQRKHVPTSLRSSDTLGCGAPE